MTGQQRRPCQMLRRQRAPMLLLVLLLQIGVSVLFCWNDCYAFTVGRLRPSVLPRHPTIMLTSSSQPHASAALSTTILSQSRKEDGDYYNDDDDREKVRVPRRRSGRRPYFDEQEEADYYYDDEERETRSNRRAYYDDDDDEEYDDDEEEDDYDTGGRLLDDINDVLEDLSYEDYDEDMLVPNPIIDNIDPDGAGERFGEIARDPKFWVEVLIFLAVLNFVDYVAHVPIF